jgi:hypothetical protein
MPTSAIRELGHLQQQGYAMLEHVLSEEQTASLAAQLEAALEADSHASVLRSRGRTYGARNLLEIFPAIVETARRPVLRDFVRAVLGEDAVLVRGLFFDKPPERSWSLPWHRDLTIAVQANDLPSKLFRNPTTKAGVPHVEAPRPLLERMLTLRIHLDAVTDDNGPLSVLPGSHHSDEPAAASPVCLHAQAGDVLAMRPLLSHASRLSHPDNTLHRRILHLEFAAEEILPEGFAWYAFLPLRANSS